MGDISELLGQNGANRYVFTIHSKTKAGISVGGSFIVSYFPGDSAAISFAEWLEAGLANRAKVAVSKTIRMADNEELAYPLANVTDEQDIKLLLGSSQDRDVRVSIRVPKLGPEASAAGIFNGLTAKGVMNWEGKPLDKLLTASVVTHNISGQGLTSEPGFDQGPPPPFVP